jgi:DnaJ-domain-containing protein 1|tara:strand:- start:455 stop:787 length:333 start_codon:yes stop_codon:yes gene_type:complete
MKELTQDEILNMTLDDAWNITQEYADLIERESKKGKSMLYEFEDVLPYSKSDILLALLKLLNEQNYDDVSQLEDFKEFISSLIMQLNDFIPTKAKHKQMLSHKKYLDEML